MKELTSPDKEKQETIEIVAQAQNKKEIRLISSQRKIPGLILWEYDQLTKSLEVAKYKKTDAVLPPLKKVGNTWELAEPLKISFKVSFNANCIYFQALNRKNAIKVLSRDYFIDYDNQKE